MDARIDSGFDGDLRLSVGLYAFEDPPVGAIGYFLADGSSTEVEAYDGVVQLGSFDALPATIILTGPEVLVGRGVTDRYSLLLDRGGRVVVES